MALCSVCNEWREAVGQEEFGFDVNGGSINNEIIRLFMFCFSCILLHYYCINE